jgi:hypothetical protein
VVAIEFNNRSSSRRSRRSNNGRSKDSQRSKNFESSNIQNKVRNSIITFYIIAVIYCIPQMFEKEIVVEKMFNQTYIFTNFTRLGRSHVYR